MEKWLPVQGFEGIYGVCETGAVMRVGTGKVLSPFLRGGYPCVTLRKPGRKLVRAIHTIVLEAFVGPRPLKHHGAHLDGDRFNAVLRNLAWATPSENEAHKRRHGTATAGERSPHARLSQKQATIIREIAAAGISQRKIAELIGLCETGVSDIVRGKSYRAA